MSNISNILIQPQRETGTADKTEQALFPHDVRLQKLAKNAVKEGSFSDLKTRAKSAPQIGKNLQEGYIQSNTSLEQKGRVLALSKEKNISLNQLESLYKNESGGYCAGTDALYADLASAAVLFEKIQPLFSGDLKGKDTEFLNHFQELMLCTDSKNFKSHAAPLNSLLDELKKNVQNSEELNAVSNIITQKEKALEKIKSAVSDINAQKPTNKISFDFLDKESSLVGQGAALYAQSSLRKQSEQLNALRNLNQIAILDSGSVAELLENCSETEKKILTEFSSQALTDLSLFLEKKSSKFENLFSLKQELLSLGKSNLTNEDFAVLTEKINQKIQEGCKNFCQQNNIRDTFLSDFSQAEKFYGFLKETDFSNQLFQKLQTNPNSLNFLCSCSASDKTEIKNTVGEILSALREHTNLINDFNSLISETVSNQDVKNLIHDNIASMQSFVLTNPIHSKLSLPEADIPLEQIDFSAHQKLLENVFSNKAYNKLNDINALLVHSAFSAYKLEHPEAEKNIAKCNEFFAAFGSNQEKVKNIAQNINTNLFKNSLENTIAKLILMGTSSGINTDLLRNALLSLDENQKFTPHLKKIENAANKLLGMQSSSGIESENLKEIISKRLSETDLGTHDAALQKINEAFSETQKNLENLADDPALTEIMQRQGISDPKKIEGERTAMTLILLQHCLAKDLSDISEYQLEKLSLSPKDLNDFSKLEQAITNNKEMLSSTFEFALLAKTYISQQNHTFGWEELNELSTKFELNDETVKNIFNLSNMTENNRLEALSALKIFGHNSKINLHDFSSSTSSLNLNKESKMLKEQFKILQDSQSSPAEKNTAAKTILSMINGTEQEPTMKFAELILANKWHDSLSNPESLKHAFEKSIKSEGIAVPEKLPALQTITDIITRDKLFLVNSGQKAKMFHNAAIQLQNNSIRNYDKNILNLCKDIAFSTACMKFDYPRTEDMLLDLINAKNIFSDKEKINEFKTSITNSLTELGISQELAFAVTENEINQNTTMQLTIKKAFSDIKNILDNFKASSSEEEKINNFTDAYNASSSILSMLTPGSYAALDAERGISVNFSPMPDTELDLKLAFENGIIMGRNNLGNPVVSVNLGLNAGIIANFNVEDIMSSTAGAEIKGNGILTMEFDSDTDAAFFLSKTVSRLADSSDLMYAKKASISGEAGAKIELSTELDINAALDIDDMPVEIGANANISLGGKIKTERHQNFNILTMEGCYSLQGGITAELGEDKLKTAAKLAVKDAEAKEKIEEGIEISKSYGVKVSVAAQTNITGTKIEKAELIKTLTEVNPISIEIFCTENSLSDEQAMMITKQAEESDAKEISLRFAYNEKDLNKGKNVPLSMVHLSGSQGKLVSCDMTVALQENEDEKEKSFKIAALSQKTKEGIYGTVNIFRSAA